jgi:ribonucleoside-diphosphate reductase alpha chain
MARQAKRYEEARKDAEAFFRGDLLRTEVFLSRYALRTLDGKWLETTPDRMWDRVAAAVARPEKDRAFWRRRFRGLLEAFKFVPAGRILFGVENPRAATLFNCYFIPVREDSVGGITRWIKEASRTYARGGGVGTNIDVLRPRGARVRNAGVESSGSASFMEVFSAVTGVMGGSRGRRGALMITTRVDHPDILEFITAKNDPDRRQVRNANLSVRVSDEFMRTLGDDGEVRLRFAAPRERVERTEPARRIWQTLLESAWASAEPGVLFWDTVLRESTTQYNGMEVRGVNVCGEIPMEPYGACNLGSVNLAAFVGEPFTERASLHWEALSEAVRLAVRFLDNVIDVGAARHALRDQRRASARSRRVGLGILGMADCLAALNLVYGSDASLAMLDHAMGVIKEAAYEESILLAEEKGSFPAIDPARHLEGPFLQRLPDTIRNGIRTKGLRNCALLAVAPTGSISCLAGTSSGIEPIFSLSYLRHVAGTVYKVEHPVWARYRERHGPSAALPASFVTARRIDPDARVRLQALVQRHVDQSISSTVNLPAETSLSAVGDLYRKAWEAGCKGITVFREGTRASVLEEAGPDGACRAEAEAPLGVCTRRRAPRIEAPWGHVAAIRLPAGDDLGVAEYGRPDGRPVFYFHGLPGSHVEASLAGLAAEELGVRIVAFDRPGIGCSTFRPDRRITDVASDAERIADALGIGPFSALGVSGGAPYALACGILLPRRVRRIALVAPAGPFAERRYQADLGWPWVVALAAAAFFPFLFRGLLRATGRILRAAPEEHLGRRAKHAGSPDREILQAHRSVFAGNLREAFRGGSRGPTRDAELLLRPWGFQPAEAMQPVFLWHGGRDRTIPQAVGIRLSREIPRCTPSFPPDEGHFSLPVGRIGEILSALAAE